MGNLPRPALRYPENRSGLRCSSDSPTAAVIPQCLPLPPAAALRDSALRPNERQQAHGRTNEKKERHLPLDENYAILSASKGTMLARSALLIPREAGGAASLKTHPPERRDCPVTTMEILTLCFVIIGICGLFIQANKK